MWREQAEAQKMEFVDFLIIGEVEEAAEDWRTRRNQ